MTKGTLLACAGAIAVLLAPQAQAAPKKLRPVAAPQKANAGKWMGTRPVAIASGEVRVPSPEEASDLAASLKGMLDRSGAGTTPLARADGAPQISLESQFGSVVLTRPTAEGGFETRCVTTFEGATTFLGLVPVEEK
jgi:hypothetical protein